MPNLKDIKTRIESVKKTRQITQAMKLVAGAKLKRATDAATSARPYKDQLQAVLERVATKAGDDLDEPLLTDRDNVSSILIVVLTSDRGLCGAFNNNLLRKVHQYVQDQEKAGLKVDVIAYGRKATTFLKARNVPMVDTLVDWANLPKMDVVRPLADSMVAGFVEGKYDQVLFASNDFVSVLTQTPVIETMLPIKVEGGVSEDGDYRYEPGPEEILGTLLPLYLRTLVLQKVLETEAGEHASRMTAMDSATRNASDLIDGLTLEYNRARQAAITTELIEIVSGASAL